MKTPVQIFTSYCHEDKQFLDGLERHMIALKRSKLVNSWSDKEIKAGDDLNQEISDSLGNADIVLLMVSVDFLNSDYCMSKEFQKALERKKATESPRIIPIIARACDWTSIPELAGLKAPLNGHAINAFQDKDTAFLEIVKELRKVIEGQQTENDDETTYSLPKDEDAFGLLCGILEHGKPENRKRAGVMYMKSLSSSQRDLISFSLNPNSGPVHTSTRDHPLPNQSEFCETAQILHDCGIFDEVIIDQDNKWGYYRYRINMSIDLEELKRKVNEVRNHPS